MRKRLTDLIEIDTGVHLRKSIKYVSNGLYKFVQPKDMYEGKIHVEALENIDLKSPRERFFLEKGDILIKNAGSNYDSAVLKQSFDDLVFSSSFFKLRVKSDRILPGYLLYFLKSPRTQYELSMLATGSSIKTINKDTFKEIFIDLPDLETQKILSEINNIGDREISIYKELIQKKQKYYNAMLNKFNKRRTENG